NYKKSDISFEYKRNLVLVFLESMEKGYGNISAVGKNLIPELEELSKKNISFSGYIQTHGSGWTQASHINMLLGLPLRFPCATKKNQQMALKDFLPKASSLSRVLHSHGYTVHAFLGSSASFSDLDKFFRTHGFDAFYDRHFFDKNGYARKENYGTGWGYKDSFIYERAFEEYRKLSSAGKPFFLMLETIDTHLPHGYVEKHQKEFGDIRDAIRQSSIMCAEFVKKLYDYNGLDNTTVVIVGDHNWMMNRSVKFTSMMEKIYPREIYNVFINTPFSAKDVQMKRSFAPFDMAPTILEAIGAELKEHRFALGTSLFSKEKTLLEKHGAAYVNGELAKKSPFYMGLF
ncbi:LTA synthase family protein, partial [Mailhella sp.]|uniref:LTA synthase family protein n=1 Tax=Mailhella sp. TaxID=1981029 RepID=UPI00406456A1